jgi:acyl-coenzyme A synthetase/AMP-(fatty) acid ligase
MHQDLLKHPPPDTPGPDFGPAWCLDSHGSPVSFHQYRYDLSRLMSRLPDDGRFALNLCRDRYCFLLAFHAVALKGQTNLLPPNQAPATRSLLLRQYDGSYLISDQPVDDVADVPRVLVQTSTDSGLNGVAQEFEVPSRHLAAILFTSGSTGRPSAVSKTWGELQTGVRTAADGLDLTGNLHCQVIATVPPQHMFGLEFSAMLPLSTGIGFHHGQPFFPEDVRQALQQSADRGVLVTTPIHLRTCLESGIDWNPCGCRLLLSATAPLSQELAESAEARFGAPLKEIYGSTETGAIAWRRTAQEDDWHLFPGLSLNPRGEQCRVSGGHFSVPKPVGDRIELLESGRFRLLGRHADLIKIAGKRSSLSELNQILQRIEGVQDGCFVDPAEPGQESRRLAAVVVAPGLERRQLLDALAQWIDPVFLPRPLLFVDALPRNEIGKLPQQALRTLLGS